MMDYMTRHLVADTAFRHEGQQLQPGDRFFASGVDAGYLTRHGRAHDAPPDKLPAAAAEPASSSPAQPAQATAPESQQSTAQATAPPRRTRRTGSRSNDSAE
jgi:hypothetical protein